MSERIKELEKYNYSIKKWYKGKRKILTIISSPGNTTLIFKEIIEEVLNNNQKVLYTWNGTEVNKELLKRLNNDEVQEIIMATNPTVEGEATAMYISRLIKPMGLPHFV